MKRTEIILIGAGQLGSRHLQGLASVRSHALDLWVVDPSDESLKIARSRFEEAMVGQSTPHIAHFSKSISECPQKAAVAIVATSSDVRRKVIDELLAQCQIEHLVLEKFLFQREEEYVHVATLVDRAGVKAYVNCPYRMYPSFQRAKSVVQGTDRLVISAVGGQWGLACNSVHVADVFLYLTGEAAWGIHDRNLLSREIFPAKRDGFFEFHGTIQGHAGKHSLTMKCDSSNAPLIWIVQCDRGKFIIDDRNHTCMEALPENDWEWVSQVVAHPYQSQLTGPLVEELLSSGTCALTPLSVSIQAHLPLLRFFTRHFEMVTHQAWSHCPIT